MTSLFRCILSFTDYLNRKLESSTFMADQNKQHIDNFLASLSFDSQGSDPDYQSETISYPIGSFGWDKNGRSVNFESSEIKVWFKPVDQFSIESLLGIINSNLRRKGHLQKRGISLSVLGMYLMLRGSNTESGYFYEILDNVIKSSVTFYYIFPKFENLSGDKFKSINLGKYYFGKLNTYKLGQQSRRAKSDYFERYERELLNRMAIERTFENITLVNWWAYREKRKTEIFLVPKTSKIFGELSENYFDHISVALYDEFLRQLTDEQDLTTSLGGSYIDEKDLISFPLIDRLAIFHDVDGTQENGFVKSLKNSGFVLNMGGIDTLLPKTQNTLKNEFYFTEFTTHQLHQTLKSFSRFVAKAKRYRDDGYLEEAFLHFIIPLDMLFGKESSSTDSVSRRVSVLTYNKSSLTFTEQTKKIRNLYSERSKYVHEGRTPQEQSLREAEAICEEVILCLLRLQKDKTRLEKLIIDDWKKDIDVVAALLESNREPDVDLLTACGIV